MLISACPWEAGRVNYIKSEKPSSEPERLSLNVMVLLGNLLHIRFSIPYLTGKAEQEGKPLPTGGFGHLADQFPFLWGLDSLLAGLTI